jgi:hypothetical protein
MFDLLSLVGGGLGGALRAVPEVMKMMGAKDERKHELEMTKLQMEIDSKRSQGAIALVQAQGETAQNAGEMQAYIEAIKGQSQLTGVKWIDGINSTVRPFVTYWFMFIYSMYKSTVIYNAWFTSSNIQEFGAKIWDANDWATLSMILSFWFVDRVFKYHNK